MPSLGSDRGSAASSPAMASNSKARSSTLRAIGPSWPSVPSIFAATLDATRPGDGRSPTTPQKLAGLRRLPPRSEPCATQAMPVASATAAPPDDPAAERVVFHGFKVRPKTSLKVLAPAPNSGVFDIAKTMPPLFSRWVTRRFEDGAIRSLKIGEPCVERTPATSVRSLIGTGRPARIPRSATGFAINSLA